MSHTTTYQHKVKDVDLFCKIATERGHEVMVANQGQTITVQQYGQNWVNDAIAQVHLKGWRFPLAIKKNGEIMYDHWGSKANTMEELGKTLQEYNSQLISKNIQWDQVENWTTKKVANGDTIITLEY